MSLVTAHQMAADLAAGKTTSRKLVEASLARIDAVEPRVKALLHVRREAALRDADAADARRACGSAASPLDGVPVIVKDNLCTEGEPTTCASKILAGFRPPYDATAVRRLREGGMVIVGKANLDEFAMGSSTENSAFGASRNPWDITRVPGGSSGGSAAAVAAGEAPIALGSDTGGSIRHPSAFCGLTGLKPTYGRVSRYGLVAFASSLDQIGPMAADVLDCAHAMNLLAGHDPMDSTSAPVPVPDYVKALEGASLKGLRIARPREFFPETGIDPEVRASVDSVVETLRRQGAQIVDVSMPHVDYAIATYYLIATAEASSNLARYDGAHYGHRTPGTKNIVEMFSRSRAEGFGPEVKRRIMIGTYALSAGFYDAYYLKASKVRTLVKRDYDSALAQADLIIAPTTPSTAFKLGEKAADPLAMYLADIFTISLNLAGYCGLSMPCGFDSKGLPIGFQLFAGAYQEERLLRAAFAAEKALGVANVKSALL
jgi:aspartyl-tRNA(Asn)/glutamyl-tRNA(Gln) amidotransferase subunit A